MLIQKGRELYDRLMSDSLSRNSIFLMASTLVTLGFGFFFWIILARFYDTAQVGLAATLISAVSLLIVLSSLGLDTGLVRYLPKSKTPNKKINTVLWVTALSAAVCSLIFVLGTPLWSKELTFLRSHWLQTVFFMLSAVFMSLFTLIEGIFLSFQSAEYILWRNILTSVIKLALPLLLIGFGAMGAFGAQSISSAIGFLFLFIILQRKFRYRFEVSVDGETLKTIFPYSFAIYVSGLAGSLPLLLLPLIITSKLGPESTAYYYTAMMLANVLFMIPNTTTQSLFAHGSRDERNMNELVMKTFRIIALLVLPAMFFLAFLGKFVLLLFGKAYSAEGFRFLQLLAVSGIFFSYNVVCGTLLRIKFRTKAFSFMTVFGSVVILGLTYFFLPHGLVGVGMGWLFGQCIITAVYALFMRKTVFG